MILDKTTGDLRNPADLDLLDRWFSSHSPLHPLPEISDDAMLPAHWFCIRGERLFIGPKERPAKDSQTTLPSHSNQ